MDRSIRAAFFLLGFTFTHPAFADLKVATSIEDLASVAQAVGGKHVTATSLCKGFQDPHFVPAKPSLMKAIQQADVYISTGLELDSGWLSLVLPGSRNPRIQVGAPGFVDASEGISVLDEPSGQVSRAEGDVHPLGNPHYYMDPVALGTVADHLARVFSGLDPMNATDYGVNAKAFKDKMEASLKVWKKELGPYRGSPIVTFHKNYGYFFERFGLKLFATVEPKPGIPPSPRYLAETAEKMRKAGVKIVLYQPFSEVKVSKELAKKAGATALEAPAEVGGAPEAKDTFSKFDLVVSLLIENLKPR